VTCVVHVGTVSHSMFGVVHVVGMRSSLPIPMIRLVHVPAVTTVVAGMARVLRMRSLLPVPMTSVSLTMVLLPIMLRHGMLAMAVMLVMFVRNRRIMCHHIPTSNLYPART
jgi:hypothetical protein